jgi:Peptidase family M3
MYSLVFAADMYSAVFKSDPLDPARGDRYRRSILQPGGSREELDSLKVESVNSSVDIETERFAGIPRTRAKSGCICRGNIWKVVNEDDSGITRRIDKTRE